MQDWYSALVIAQQRQADIRHEIRIERALRQVKDTQRSKRTHFHFLQGFVRRLRKLTVSVRKGS